MIPRDYITEWRARAPWADNAQIEQDLVICRALVSIFSHPVLNDALAFRGGTAFYKLYLTPAARYSEDIDFVQVRAEPAGAVMDALREVLDPWLGKPQWKQTEGRVTFNYRFSSEDPTPLPLRLKVEVNTREHFTTHGLRRLPFAVAFPLVQRRRRHHHLRPRRTPWNQAPRPLSAPQGPRPVRYGDRARARCIDPARIVAAVRRYMDEGGHRVTRAEFEGNLAAKIEDKRFPVGHPALACRRPKVGCGPSRRGRRGTAVPATLVETSAY